MNIPALATTCYDNIELCRLKSAITHIPGLSGLWDPPARDPSEAIKRATARLGRYYANLRILLQVFGNSVPTDALNALGNLQLRDEELLGRIYAAAAEETSNEPGIAFFLRVKHRSIALLPTIVSSSGGTLDRTVYMASSWKAAISRALQPEERKALQIRILRSNLLWQRERIWVLPASDTVEAHGEEYGTKQLPTVFFNDISRHQSATDGWVDAFWGVQSGLRVAIPLPSVPNATFVLLLTTCRPGAFEWDSVKERYKQNVPSKIASKILAALRNELNAELAWLSFAAQSLRYVTEEEPTLLDGGMRMIEHHLSQAFPTNSPDWQWTARTLAADLDLISDRHCREALEYVDGLEQAAFRKLEDMAATLPARTESRRWLERLQRVRAEKRHQPALLSRECTLKNVVEMLDVLAQRHTSTVIVDDAVRNMAWRPRLHGYLLTAILANLVEGRNVAVHVSVEGEMLYLTAFYKNWNLTAKDEEVFLLQPLKGRRTTGSGFFRTAQLLWNSGGSIEYYRLRGSPESPALLRLGIRLQR
jgi:hypothetical protein